jgi:hypothetical protein
VGIPFRLKLEGIKVTRQVRQQIADEMMIRIPELTPLEYYAVYEKVTKRVKNP